MFISSGFTGHCPRKRILRQTGAGQTDVTPRTFDKKSVRAHSKSARPFPGPAFDDYLLVCIELDRIAPLPVRGSEEAVAPAAKWKIRHRSRNPDVHSDIAGGHFVAELPRRGSARRKNRGHITVGISRDNLDPLFQCFCMDKTQDRPENLRTRKHA